MIDRKKYKVIRLESGYNSKHKNTFNSYTPKEENRENDYTLRMLRKIFKRVNRVTKVNKNIFEVASFIE